MKELDDPWLDGDAVYDFVDGDPVTLPNGDVVTILEVDHDSTGVFFTCVEQGQKVWYYFRDVVKPEEDAREHQDRVE